MSTLCGFKTNVLKIFDFVNFGALGVNTTLV